MKRSVALCLVFAAVGVRPPVLAQSDTEVEQLMRAFLVPFSSGHVSQFMEYFSDDAVVFFPSPGFASMRVEGKAEIARTFAKVFKPGQPVSSSGQPMIQPQDLKVQRFGDTAVVTFHLGSATSRGRRTFVLSRIDGKWRIVHLHASTIAAPPVR